MAWTRGDDGATFHPRVMALGRGHDDRQLNEAWGACQRLLAWSADHETDGWLPDEIIDMVMGAHRTRLWAVLRKNGHVAGRLRHPEHGPGWQVIIDHPDFLAHNRTKKQRQLDQAARAGFSTSVRLRILARDGDQCRYCHITVIPNDRRGGRGRHFDHYVNDGPSTVENGRVACAECNGRKADGVPTDDLQGDRDPRPPLERGEELYLHSRTRLELEEARLITTARPTDVPAIPRPVDDTAQRDPGDPDGTISAHLRAVDAAVSGPAADQTHDRGGGPVISRAGSGSVPGRSGQARAGEPRRRRGRQRHRTTG